MKKNFYLAGLVLSIISLSACQKDLTESEETQTGQQAMISRTMYAGDDEWQGAPDVRSAYDPTLDKVKLDGTEQMAVFYRYKDDAGTESKLIGVTDSNPLLATTSGGREYGFTHEAVTGAASYSYYFIMPFQYTTVRLNSAGASAYVKLSPVQLPAADSFDPAFDLLIGKPVLDIPAGETAASYTIGGFKRMFAPFRIQLRDGSSLLGNEKIRTSTLSFGQETSSTGRQSLIGVFYFNMGSTFETNDFLSIQAESMGNAVSALYPEGQAADAGVYPVWYIVNSTKFTAGTPVTLTVSTDSKTYTRTALLTADREVVAGRMNNLGFNLTGEGVTMQESLTQDFTAGPVSNAGDYALTASDGKQYTWSFSGSNFRVDGKSNSSTLSDGLRLSNTQMTLPTIPGKRITEIRVFTHVLSNSTTSTTAVCNLSLYSGETSIADYDYNYYNQNGSNIAKNGGVMTMTVPADYQNTPLTIKGDAAAKFISAVTLILEDNTAPAIVVSDQVAATESTLTFAATLYNATSWKYICLPASATAPDAAAIYASGTEVSGTSVTVEGLTALTSYTLYAVAIAEDGTTYSAVANRTTTTSAPAGIVDYYTKYSNGEDIVIGTLTINKTTFPDAVSVNPAELTETQLQTGGLFFINNESSGTGDPCTGKTSLNTAVTNPLILIGRYEGAALAELTLPELRCRNDVSIMNLGLIGSATYMFTKNGATNNTDLRIVGCSIDYGTKIRYLIYDNRFADGATELSQGFVNVWIDNSVIKYNTSGDQPMVYRPTKEHPYLQSITISNNVIYAETMMRGFVVSCGDGNTGKCPTPNLTLTAENNTIYNIWNSNSLFRGTSMPVMIIRGNAGYLDYTGTLSVTSSNYTGLGCIYLNVDGVTSSLPIAGNYLYYQGTADGNSSIPWALRRNGIASTNGTNTITGDQTPFSSVNTATGYFPIEAAVTSAGASYASKRWKEWQ